MAFGIFCMYKKGLFWFTSRKRTSLCSIQNVLQGKIILLDNTSKLLGKNHEMMANVLFISVKKNLTFCQTKSFSVFRGLPWAPPNTLKLSLAKCFIIFFLRLWKIHLPSFQDFFHKKICRYYLAMWLLTIIYFKLRVTKDFFLYYIYIIWMMWSMILSNNQGHCAPSYLVYPFYSED